jgi:selenium-binding protein 1
MAAEAPAERLAYVALLATGDNGQKDALGVIDVDPTSPAYGRLVNKVEFPHGGNELHHFGWNACSSHLCAYAPHPHVERRYLVVPGTHSSRIHVVDTQPDPRSPKLVKVIEPDEVMKKTGYAAPHTVHCGPDGVYLNALGNTEGDGPGGIFVLDHETFDVKGAWEKERGPQYLSYDFWWHLGQDTMITSEWGTPNMVTGGLNPELLLGGKYGNALHVWIWTRSTSRLDPGRRTRWSLSLAGARPRRPTASGVVISRGSVGSVWNGP